MPSSGTSTQQSADRWKIVPFVTVGVISLIVALILAAPLKFGIPVGWDVFYHLRVAELAKESGNLINYDQLSAGGRYHNYVPGNTALLLSISELTRIPLDRTSMLFPLIFSALSIASFYFIVRKEEWGLFGTAVFAFTIETLDFFVASGMPQQPAIFLMLLMFAQRKINPLFALTLGITHQSTLIILAIFEIMRIGSEKIGSIINRLSTTLVGFIPYLLWVSMLGVSLSLPTWGWPVSLDYYMQKLDYRIAVLSLFGLGVLPSTLWLLVFALLTQSPLLPRRYLFPLGIALSFSSIIGLKRLPLPKIGKTIVAGVLIILIGSAAVNFGRWLEPITKYEDVNSGLWIRENLVRGVLSHKDLSTIWVLYYGKVPTVLDGFSEGVPDSHQRMEDVLRAFESHELSDALTVLKKYNCSYILFNKAETEWLGADTNKFLPLTALYDNGYSKVLSAT